MAGFAFLSTQGKNGTREQKLCLLDAVVFVLIDLDEFTLKYSIIMSQGFFANSLP